MFVKKENKIELEGDFSNVTGEALKNSRLTLAWLMAGIVVRCFERTMDFAENKLEVKDPSRSFKMT